MKNIFLLCISCFSLLGGKLYSREMLDYESLAKLPVSELFKKGSEYKERNQIDTAMGYYIILAGRYNENMNKSDKYLCTMACSYAGQIYYQKENYSKAFDLYLKGIQISEENDFRELLSEFYKNIGNIYSVFEDNQQAMDCYKKGLEYARKYGNEDVEVKLLINLSGICCYSNYTREAKIYYDEMIKFIGKDTLVEYFGYLNKALILTNEKKYDLAIVCYENAAEYAKRVQLDARYTGSVYGELAKLYEKMGKNDSALYYFHINTDFSQKNNLMYMLIENLKAQARLYEKKGNLKKSLLYKSWYFNISDSLFSTTEFNRMKNAQFIYEVDKNYQRIASLTAEKEKRENYIKAQRAFLIVISASLFIFVILLIIVYVQKGKLYHAYRDLFNRNNEILQSEQQNKKFRIEYERKLEEERMYSAHLEQQLKKVLVEERIENSQKKEMEDVKLYSADKLTDAQKENLLININKIMENTKDFCDCDFGLERLAELIGSNSRYISQIINETYNKNFRTFINEYRIKEAQLRLLNTAEYGNYTIKAIAESVGYKSQANFIAIFRKVTGITPSIYQKIAKGE